MKTKLFNLARVEGWLVEDAALAAKEDVAKIKAKIRAKKLAKAGKLSEALEESTKASLSTIVAASIKKELEEALR